jgi:hypothetical protein
MLIKYYGQHIYTHYGNIDLPITRDIDIKNVIVQLYDIINYDVFIIFCLFSRNTTRKNSQNFFRYHNDISL